MTSKSILQNDKRLCSWWSAISHSEDFQRILIHVRSDVLALGLSAESIKGIQQFENLLTGIADSDEVIPAIPSPGLEHDVEGDLGGPPLEVVENKKVVVKPKKKGK